jgi:hypothetical protein
LVSAASGLPNESVNFVAVTQSNVVWCVIFVDTLTLKEKPHSAWVYSVSLAKCLEEFSHSGAPFDLKICFLALGVLDCEIDVRLVGAALVFNLFLRIHRAVEKTIRFVLPLGI